MKNLLRIYVDSLWSKASVTLRYGESQIPRVTITLRPRRRPNHYRYWPNIQRTDSNRRANGAGYRIRIGNFALEGRRVTVKTLILHKRTFDIFSFGCGVVYPEILQIFQRCNHLLYPRWCASRQELSWYRRAIVFTLESSVAGAERFALPNVDVKGRCLNCLAKPQYEPLAGLCY